MLSPLFNKNKNIINLNTFFGLSSIHPKGRSLLVQGDIVRTIKLQLPCPLCIAAGA